MIVLGLGSNVGDRLGNLQRAVGMVRGFVSDLRCSPIYESAALLPEHAPESWDTPFLNMAVAGETSLTPQACLIAAKTMEAQIGRQQRGHWGPREIDIDILVYDDRVVDTPDLILPHAGLLLRDFVLQPLCALAPDWCYPVKGEHEGKTAHELARAVHSTLKRTTLSVK